MKHIGKRMGRWTIKGELGSGGNGCVWSCEDQAGATGAMKLLHEKLLNAKDPGSRRRVQRFCDEILFLRSNTLAGVIPLLDSNLPTDGESTDDQTPWMVMPLAQPLSLFLDETGRSLSNAVRAVCAIANTLSQLHAKRVSHRDVKPDNLLVLNGAFVLGDFGLVDFEGKPEITGNQERLGPLFYMAPEMRDKPDISDGRAADVYALAKTLWVLATGQRYPLPGEQRASVSALTLSAYVNDARAVLLDWLVDRCTRHVASERPSMADVSEELTAWLSSQSSDLGPLEAIPKVGAQMTPVYSKQLDKIAAKERAVRAVARLTEIASSILQPLADSLQSLPTLGSDGGRLPTRLTDGEGHTAWDQWLYPSTIVDWNRKYLATYGSMTSSQFSLPTGSTALLLCGVRLVLYDVETLELAAAVVCHASAPLEGYRIVWKQIAKVSPDSARADAVIRELCQGIIDNASMGAACFAETIENLEKHA